MSEDPEDPEVVVHPRYGKYLTWTLPNGVTIVTRTARKPS